ncbi:MAG: glycosyltransferase family 2 protein [Candidatus Omnitrophica bacterium]|nr:glycosyltransferase family 2 protein [Candidatus Omnitrophota bacterium]
MLEDFPVIDIITVNYNGRHFLEEFFTAIVNLSYPKDKIRLIFIDNNSKDGSIEWVKSQKTDFSVILLTNKKNLGFATANNLAFRICKAEFIALLNNDTKVEPDWLVWLVRAIRSDSGIGIVSSRQLPKESPRLIDPQSNETSWCSGGHCLIRRSCLEKVGYFDDKFFMYGEDVDLSWRMWLHGYKCLYVPEAICYHHYKSPERFIERRLMFHVRNSILLRYTYGRRYDILRQVWKWIKEAFAFALKRGDFKKAFAICSGVFLHAFCIAHFIQKGRRLKRFSSFEQVKQKWITL